MWRARWAMPWGAFLSVALPSARPAIAVGVSLVLMECLNDIGRLVSLASNPTLGIYTTWLGEGNLGGAAQLAVVLLIFVFALLWVERHAAATAVLHARHAIPMAPRRTPLDGLARDIGHLACFLPVFLASSCRRSFSCALQHGMWNIFFSASYFDAHVALAGLSRWPQAS